MSRTVDQAHAGVLAHLPPGWAYSHAPHSVVGRALRPLGAEAAAFDARAEALLVEAHPGQSTALLPDYERVLGPDPCRAAVNPAMEARQAAAWLRWTARGGASRRYFVGLAAQLGFAIQITEYRPRRFGARFGERHYGLPWAHVWTVTAPLLAAPVRRRFGDRFGRRYRSWGNGVIECTLDRLRPAHTLLRWRYSGPLAGADLGAFQLGQDLLTPS